MKSTLFVFTTAFFMLFTFSSCEKAVLEGSGDDTEATTQKTQLVSLNLASETTPMVGASRVPLSSQIVYGINVYAKKEGFASYAKYAYGLFIDVSKVSLELPEGSTYKFECVAIQDDESQLFHEGLVYKAPYLHGDAGLPTEASNAFVRSTSENLSSMKNFSVNLMGQDDVAKVSHIYKYYGVVDGYNPAAGADPQLALKKMVYGLHFSIKPPKEGTLKISYNGTESVEVSAQNDAYDHSFIYPFSRLDEASADNYSVTLTLFLTWTKADGTVFTGQKDITIKRNVMYNIAIDASGPNPKQFTLTLDNSEMLQENIEWHFQTQ